MGGPSGATGSELASILAVSYLMRRTRSRGNLSASSQ